MIHIVQAGQAGKTKYLIDMHRVRTKIFRDRMGWNVDINKMGLEIDEYDLPETVYILSTDKNDKVVGVWRFLPTTSPSMIRNIWPQYLKTLPIPYSVSMCETSRFGVDAHELNPLGPNMDRFGV
ncbi:MAG TPA: acyl-homoserine-lactone synthase, partial [Gammaproteobacteria bacterium]|nr:acyl-homoserine-lactone synthase [Gammaproteobacteria bacterium]